MNILDATFLASATQHHQLPPPAFAEVAFAGRSNVGKSSLINALLNRRKLVRTSSTPGCTRAINLFRVRLDEAVFDLADLPGFGYAKRSKHERRGWGPMIEGYLSQRQGLRAVVLIVDVRRGVEDEERQLLEYLHALQRTPLLVATKIDKLPASKRKLAVSATARAAGVPVYGFSATSGEGREPLLRAVLKTASLSIQDQATTE